jgi:hypothetical protein
MCSQQPSQDPEMAQENHIPAQIMMKSVPRGLDPRRIRGMYVLDLTCDNFNSERLYDGRMVDHDDKMRCGASK